MFGDLFSQNSDYQTGIIYQGRRKFLKPAGNSLEPPLLFKTKSQSRRSRSNNQSPAEKLPPLQGIEIAPQHLTSVIMNTKNQFLNLRNNGDFKSKRNIKSGTLKPMIIQHYSSIDSKDWEEQIEAGCHLYVNKNTGEVSVECPWRRDVNSLHSMYSSKKMSVKGGASGYQTPTASPSRIMLTPLQTIPSESSYSMFGTIGASGGSTASGISTGAYRVYDDSEDLGTGSLVYDRSELDDMLSMLDSAKKRGASP
jgi:hypothetical protein